MLLGVVTRFPNESHGVDAPAPSHPAASAPPALRAGYASGGRGLSCGACGAFAPLAGLRPAPPASQAGASNPAVPIRRTQSLQAFSRSSCTEGERFTRILRRPRPPTEPECSRWTEQRREDQPTRCHWTRAWCRRRPRRGALVDGGRLSSPRAWGLSVHVLFHQRETND